jgi:palmitoyltransferase ZDHHC13/17
MLNLQTRNLKRTPVFEAVWFNKRVKVIQKIVRKFVEYKPELLGKDADGQTLLHICTICGHLSLLAYFTLELKMSLEVFDNNQRTPLHIAALEGKEAASAFLIPYTENLELRDKNGFTPLQLAAFTSSYRTIRYLIMKGASRKSRTPDYNALEIGQIMTISNDVLNLLKEPACIEYLNPITPPLAKVSNSKNTFYLNIIVFLLRYLIIVLFFYDKLKIYLIIPSAMLGILSFTFLIISSAVNPGYVSKGSGLAELYISHKEEDICAYCSLFKERSMKHCQRCNKCVKKFDHHCPWIHNCVGGG